MTDTKAKRKQLEELSERREQLEMMVLWREGLEAITEDAASATVDQINKVIGGHGVLNESGRRDVQQWLRKFSLMELMTAIDEAASKRVIESIDDATAFISLIPKIATMNRKPATRRLYYIRGIVRRPLMREALEAGADLEWIEELAKSACNWTEFKQELTEAAQ